MELKKLEIKGFKSFGDKVTLHFDAGITGVVGPNGCGKSNIVDAIRWVLGEQKTKALRSEKMENIIFNGTKKRRPLQMAEVSLTFNNTKNIIPTEYSNVLISRRYYRSGESEYLLNGVQCRLKDITELFMDTGIGSDSYAIIELKMVDDILNDNNNARRTLFEEASGISKFKIRKKQTLKKLDDTDKDLNRVEDILYEIDKNLKTLEKQAKQAAQYHVLKEEYKLLSIQLAHFNMSEYQEKFKKIKKQVDDQNISRTEISKNVIEQEAKLEHLKKEILLKEKVLSSRQKTLNEHFNTIRQYESEKKIRNERLSHLNEKNNSIDEQIQKDKRSSESVKIELKIVKEEITLVKRTFNETKTYVQSLKSTYEKEKTALQKHREALTQENESLKITQNEVYQLKKSLEISEVQLTKLTQDLNNSFHDNSNSEDKVEELKKEKITLSKELNKQEQALLDLNLKEDKNNVSITNSEQKVNGIKTRLANINRKLDSTENEYKLTKSLVDNLEGFPEAIKFLNKNDKWNNNAPLLSDILTCESTYRLAIENHLSPYMNYYVVEDISEAHHAIKLLSNSSKGKAQFFVLNHIETNQNNSIATPKDTISAVEIVEYDVRYEKIIFLLLHNTFVSTNVNYNIPKDNRYTFLSLDGKITKRQHSITGGSVGLFEGKRIGRAKNLEKMSAEITVLNKQQQKIQLEIDQENNNLLRFKTNNIKKEITQVQNIIGGLNKKYTSVVTQIDQIENQLAASKNKAEAIQSNISILREGIENSTPKVKTKEQALKDVDQKNISIAQFIKKLNLQVSEHSNAYNTENVIFHQLQNKITSLEKDIEYKNQNNQSLTERINQNFETRKKVELETKKTLKTTDVSDDDLLELYDEKEQIEIGVNQAEKNYYTERNLITEFEKKIKQVNKSRGDIDTTLISKQNELNDLKLKINSIRERLSVEFNLDVDQLQLNSENSKSDFNTLEELLNAIEKVKKSIDRLGAINPMAVEAFEEIKTRHTFIKEQKDDLVEAKKSLHNTIKEIDLIARENFLTAFEAIQKNFLDVFRSLFTEEDTCSLTLVNPEEPLESAIQIIAKPKGKRPLTINQLSGGEKTLTAVALLFSIYLIKPAPFCIFDEVDAPLDDANIDKFNKIVRKFSKDSQFIIVTHNKRTMSTTDVIYGVTMPEVGVSKLVPVDFRSLPDTQ